MLVKNPKNKYHRIFNFRMSTVSMLTFVMDICWLPRFPKCHWKCHRCVAMLAGEGECACECIWLGSSHFYSICLLLLLCCQSRWWLLRRVIISASGIWHLSTRPGFCVCSHTNAPADKKKKRGPGLLWRRRMSSTCPGEFNALKRCQEGVASASRWALP